jgi:hypothetical protein
MNWRKIQNEQPANGEMVLVWSPAFAPGNPMWFLIQAGWIAD